MARNFIETCTFIQYNTKVCLCIHCTVDFMSHGLSSLATNHVLSLWPEVVYTASWLCGVLYSLSKVVEDNALIPQSNKL